MEERRRARARGLPLKGRTGSNNAITDVAGIEVGMVTLIEGEGALTVGKGPVRTGVTAILPRGKEKGGVPVFAGLHSMNGAGEMTGSHWIEESGLLEGPLAITNTHSVGAVHEGILRWGLESGQSRIMAWGLPMVAETYDGELNDLDGFHVRPQHAVEALNKARGGPVEMGSVGGGTGMICYGYKGGSGSASRVLEIGGEHFTLGVFVQSNFGLRKELIVSGVPLGLSLDDADELRGKGAGSIIAIVATDAPLLPQQLKRLARRVPLGLALTGAVGHNGSGDIFLAFSTANEQAARAKARAGLECLANDQMDDLFEATVQATEEAVLDSLFCNRDMTGRDGNFVPALPDAVIESCLARLRVRDS
jgi:L-aminopeptidase/D-esterase-like protein